MSVVDVTRASMVARLLTILFSHHCEKARWGLDRRGVAYVEEAHLPILHVRATRSAGGRSTPLLIVDDGPPLTDSTDVLHHADAANTRGEPLFPDDDARARGSLRGGARSAHAAPRLLLLARRQAGAAAAARDGAGADVRAAPRRRDAAAGEAHAFARTQGLACRDRSLVRPHRGGLR
ncbi:MAG: hypothetical protein FJ137_06330 [Deltaproteobacteria bacterium]|nr:hypothetical protein [Deltaproteobacteria bacterium]